MIVGASSRRPRATDSRPYMKKKGKHAMENATKALLIAGGVLIAIIILSVMVIMFQKTGNVTKTYDQTISQEEITKFNSNFTKYIGQELTIHEVITICKFAEDNGITVSSGAKDESKIKDDLDAVEEAYKNHKDNIDKIQKIEKVYELIIPNTAYDKETGKINNISFSPGKIKITYKK